MSVVIDKKAALRVAFLTIFLDLLGFGILIPVQAFYAEEFGASPTLVTLLGGSYSLMQFLFIPFWGRLSDRVGRRPIVLISVLISCVAYLLFGFANSLPLLFIARILAGFGNANLSTAQAIVSDTTDLSDRTKGMGMIGAAFGMGFVFGPAIGGILGHFDPRFPAFGAAVLAIINFLLAWFRLPETYGVRPDAGKVKLSLIESVRSVAEHPGVFRLLLLTTIYITAFSGMEQVAGLLIEKSWVHGVVGNVRVGQASALTAWFLVVAGVTLALVQGLWVAKLAKRFSEKVVLQVGLLIMTIALPLLPAAASTELFLLFILVGAGLAAGSGFVKTTSISLVSKLVPATKQGVTLGFNQSASALGRAFGPAIAGVLFERGPAVPFIFGGVLGGISLFLSFHLISNSK